METSLPFPTDIVKFVGFIVANGATIAVLLEQWPFFQKLSAQQKTISVFVLTVFIIPLLGALATQAIHTLPPEQVATIQGYLNLALFGLYSYTTTQVAHGLNPLRSRITTSQTSSVSTAIPTEPFSPEVTDAMVEVLSDSGFGSTPTQPPSVATQSTTTTIKNPPDQAKPQ